MSVRAPIFVSGLILVIILAAGLWRLHARLAPVVPTIAFIPQAGGPMLWEMEHLGAARAVRSFRRARLYWNTPTSEADVAGQVTLMEKIIRGNYKALVVAPNHRFALLSPIHRALEAGLPVVIVAEPLDLPPGPRLAYIVNDDEKMGELAAAEIARLMHGAGSIVVAGVTPTSPGVTLRLRGAERLLATTFPRLKVVSRFGGAYNPTLSEELTRNELDAHPEVQVVFGLTAESTRGAHAAVRRRSSKPPITIVGCDQDTDLLAHLADGQIAAIVAENTYKMGFDAVGLVYGLLDGKPAPAISVIPPLLITRRNLDSPEVSAYTNLSR